MVPMSRRKEYLLYLLSFVMVFAGVGHLLNPDFYLDLSTAIPNSTFLPKSMGTLDASGKGQAAFVLPKISNQNAIGLIFNHAYVVYDAKDNYYMASNPVSLRLVR